MSQVSKIVFVVHKCIPNVLIEHIECGNKFAKIIKVKSPCKILSPAHKWVYH